MGKERLKDPLIATVNPRQRLFPGLGWKWLKWREEYHMRNYLEAESTVFDEGLNVPSEEDAHFNPCFQFKEQVSRSKLEK